MCRLLRSRKSSKHILAFDQRKTRQLDGREAHLALAPPVGSVTPFFAVTLGGPEEARGPMGRLCHSSRSWDSDPDSLRWRGARWIVEQRELRFGIQVRYLIDLGHFSEYLRAAADSWAPSQKSLG
jgi:hypothetical protein